MREGRREGWRKRRREKKREEYGGRGRGRERKGRIVEDGGNEEEENGEEEDEKEGEERGEACDRWRGKRKLFEKVRRGRWKVEKENRRHGGIKGKT